MKNIITPAIIIVLNSLFPHTSSCQEQRAMPDYLKQKFLKYIEAVPREEVYVHSDRNEYIAGENMFFNIFLISRQTSGPSLKSSIAYFELLNNENRPVVQKRIFLNSGFGPGQIVLPDSLSSGSYTMRAYTSWMKNFLPGNCFMKEIEIYNALSSKPFRKKTSTVSDSGRLNSASENTDIVYPDLGLSVNNLKTDSLEILISAGKNYRSANSNIIYLFINTLGKINRISTEILLSEKTRISVSRKELTPGINHITFFDSKCRPVLEKFIYSPGEKSEILTVSSPDSLKLRSKISVDLKIKDYKTGPLNGSGLSISVSPATPESASVCLDDYMILGTEYGFQILNDLKDRSIADLTPAAADSLLSDVKSSWINWPVLLSGKLPDFKFKMEGKDHLLQGKLLSNNPSSADTAAYILLSTPGLEPGFQYARTDREGNFSFSINIDNELKDLIIMPEDVKKSGKLRIESSFSDQYLPTGKQAISVSKQDPSYIQMWSANYQINKIYKTTQPGRASDQQTSPLKPVRFYSKPDIELILADYISLPTMEEVFYELLPRVFLRKNKSGYEISIADRVEDNKLVLSPSILLDGVMINDAGVIAKLDPVNVVKIDVIKDKYMVGNYPFYGIVNVTTKTHDFSIIPLPEYMTRLPYRVIDPVFTFVSPDYTTDEARNSRIPDFRNTLYWNPSVTPDNEGKASAEFWSSDLPLEYLITVQGITSAGKPFSVKKLFRVIQD
jgi:hypothetical protein